MPTASTLTVAPGSVVVVRDEEWLVTSVEPTADGQLLSVRGLTELVRDTEATFYERHDDIQVLDPAAAEVVGDPSPSHRTARLWLEATLRKSPLPVDETSVTVSARALADPLPYQQAAVTRALDPENLRPRLLLADAVGLGKTLEIGMILAELVRRGRGERILIVTPRHVLEQMQHEMWTRFALPFVRLDSLGIQRVRQQLPATRNPFSHFKRVIISIDTLKSDRYLAHLRQHRWDAVVIDESHNITNSATQNNRLASVLAPQTDALILASATPHNGKKESFAELIRLLEPTAVSPDGEPIPEEVQRLVLRRHRHSPEVAAVVGAAWAERAEPRNVLVPASPAEDAVAAELADVWLHPKAGSSPHSAGSGLFSWTLAKAFLSSPAALEETLTDRIRRLHPENHAQSQEIAALERLRTLNQEALAEPRGGKYAALLEHLKSIGVGPGAPERVVIFAERIATLHWLRERLQKDLKLPAAAVDLLHGGLSDQEQMEVVESFKQAHTPVRILVTGDVASEGVNLHLQCHQLVHYDIPWSLIRLEQRNGRVDRYGQRTSPQLTALILEPSHEMFSGDLRVLARLVEKEHEAHTTLGDAASLMGAYDVEAEEKSIRAVLAGQQDFEDVVADAGAVAAGDSLAGLMARLAGSALPGAAQAATPATSPNDDGAPPAAAPTPAGAPVGSDTAAEPLELLREGLVEVFTRPEQSPREQGGGVSWREHPEQQLVELAPPKDLQRRLTVLPQSYLADRHVTERLVLATTRQKGTDLLKKALADTSDSTWPEAHFLGPLHPVLDWISDRALAALGRNEVFAVRGDVEHPAVLLNGTLTNRAGHTVTSAWLSVEFPLGPEAGLAPVSEHVSAAAMLARVGLDAPSPNPGPAADPEGLTAHVGPAVDAAAEHLRAAVFPAAVEDAQARVDRWVHRARQWEEESDALIQRAQIRQRRVTVEEERRLAEDRSPARQLVRPLLLVVPRDHPVATPERLSTPSQEA
ncbi:DEAD/DEAH box helicase [Micrococcus sp. HG099]|uniref:DEAD/DEAH box helicase n=1 Tax=Micrococcus sp. HG099 TaxID=2969755 RepID=UPI00215AD41F|nr:DEAD/DEAH box helicase [Micrococcus sp. HG099]MCR8674696.1 DEAD/DEAH box helicase [Micrococcus sp. HG099]